MEPVRQTKKSPAPASPALAPRPKAPEKTMTSAAALQSRIGTSGVRELMAARKPGGQAGGRTGDRSAPAPAPANDAGPGAVGKAEPPAGAAKDKHAPQEGGGDKAKGQAAAAGAEGAGGGEAAAGSAPVKLHVPEPPAKPSKATMRRIAGIQRRAGGKAKAQATLPEADKQVVAAQNAVTPPDAERAAETRAALIATVNAAPNPAIVKLCERIREVIRSKRPPDEDALAEAKPEEAAAEAGGELNASVSSETKKVEDNYSTLQTSPGLAPAQKAPPVPGQPAAAQTEPLKAKAGVPDAVPAADVSLEKDAEEARKKSEEAGMNKPAAALVQTGPIAEAREAQGELDQSAQEDPALVLAKQKEALGKADADMAALQAQALAALAASRGGTTTKVTARQHGMVGTEEEMRTRAGTEAKAAFDDAQTQVRAQLKGLGSTAMQKWELAKKDLVLQFKADLKKVQDEIDDRHSGAVGALVGLWDSVSGLPDWVTDDYDRAETRFADGVIKKLLEISTEVEGIIKICQGIIDNARTKIDGIFKALPASLQGWAKQEQAKFEGQLNTLSKETEDARDAFNKELKESASQAVDEVRAEIAELRKKAGGLIGRIVDAVKRFVDDPIKFIIDGLLNLLGISPAAFWAVVAKIKKVISDIVDDPIGFANNLLAGLGKGFGLFFDNFPTHMIRGFLTWLLGDLKGVQVPKDLSVKSVITFFLQIMGITWPNIRKILAKKIGEKNTALIEKVWSLISLMIDKGPEGIFEMIKEKLDPQGIVDQVVEMAVDYMVTAHTKQLAVRLLLLFNPAGAILQAIEAIYRVLKWVFQNAARIFTLIETIVNGLADVVAGNVGGFAKAVEKGLAMLIPPVLSFVADYFSLGDLPKTVATHIKSLREWILGLLESAFDWVIAKGKQLLAALGIGKKEEKKDPKKGTVDDDIGETFSFFADGERHSLWIEPAGGSVEVFVASAKEPVAALLASLKTKAAAKKLKGAKKTKAEALFVEAYSALKQTKSDGGTAKATKDAAVATPADAQKVATAQAADKAVAEEERALGTILKDLFETIGLSESDQKIEVYRLVLGSAGISVDEFEETNKGITKKPSTYRRQSRIEIVGHLQSIGGMSEFLRATAPIVPREYSKVRSQIFEEWVRTYVSVSTPAPQFLSPHKNRKSPPELKKVKFEDREKRDSDGYSGTVLYEIKSHVAGGPSGEEMSQMRDYFKILHHQLTDTKGNGPYSGVAYVFHDLEVKTRWEKNLYGTLGSWYVQVTPSE